MPQTTICSNLSTKTKLTLLGRGIKRIKHLRIWLWLSKSQNCIPLEGDIVSFIHPQSESFVNLNSPKAKDEDISIRFHQ